MNSPALATIASGLFAPLLFIGLDAQAPAPADSPEITPVLHFQGQAIHPETREGIADALVFLEGMPDSVRTDAQGRFTLTAAPERALVIEHPDFRGLRFPAEHLPAGAEILAVPHLGGPGVETWRNTPLIVVRGPGSSLVGTVAASEGEGTWCGSEDPNSAAARDVVEAIRIIHNGPNRAAEAQFGASAATGVVLVTCKQVEVGQP